MTARSGVTDVDHSAGERWLTASRQKRRVPTRHDDEPWGVRHAREIGGLTTLCGVPAVSWHLFLTRPFDPHQSEACHACSARLAPE